MKLIPILLLLSVQIMGQKIPEKKTLVADETWVVPSGAASFRVITSNDSVAHWMMKKFEEDGLKRVSYLRKEDRKGKYWERSFYFSNKEWDKVKEFIKNCFK